MHLPTHSSGTHLKKFVIGSYKDVYHGYSFRRFWILLDFENIFIHIIDCYADNKSGFSEMYVV